MTSRIFSNCRRGLWVLMPALWFQGCASTGQPALPLIVAEIITSPEGVEISYRGNVVGNAPLEVRLDRLDEAVELSPTVDQPPIVERRIKILGPERVQVLIRLGHTPSPSALALGLTRVVVFDYGSLTTFDVDQYALKPDLLPMLRRQASVLKEHFNKLDVYICGHTDSTGGDEHNQVLSVNRAQSVADFLVAQGLGAERVRVQGLGADYPIADNATREGRQLNRRTEIILPD